MKHWEGDPIAINSVRRPLKSRAVQLEQVAFCRSRRFDRLNTESFSRPTSAHSEQLRASTSLGLLDRRQTDSNQAKHDATSTQCDHECSVKIPGTTLESNSSNGSMSAVGTIKPNSRRKIKQLTKIRGKNKIQPKP